jgi:hypothetical protein
LGGHPVHPQQQRHHVQQYPQQRGENSSEGSDGTVYCMCLQAHDQDYFISCDRCGDWCHVKCVGMTIAAARAAKSWCCPLCWAVTGDKGPLTAASERLAKVGGVADVDDRRLSTRTQFRRMERVVIHFRHLLFCFVEGKVAICRPHKKNTYALL